MVFPRHGFIEQPNETKAASLIALRAADIVARRCGWHIAQSLGHDCGTQCQAAKFAVNTDSTLWQMLYPEKQTRCTVPGQEPLKHTNKRYAWVMWRRYEGCIQGSGRFLWSIGF